MSNSHALRSVVVVLGAIASFPATIRATDPPGAGDTKRAADKVSARTPQQTVTRALSFLRDDAAKWRKERGCATCHHGTMTVWALSEARHQGHAVEAETLAELTKWTKERFIPRMRAPRDPRPGWNLVGVSGIYLGAMSQTLPILSREEVGDLASHLARHQDEDGGWMMPPPANGAPPTWESRETLALWALLAWEPTELPDPEAAAATRAAREKAVAWLAKTTPTNTTQSFALRLALASRTKRPESETQPIFEELLRRQQPDGGWRQADDSPTDAYATGQTLWALSFANVTKDRPEVKRAIDFLSATQLDEGSWPIPQRKHPEDPSNRQRNPVPITYFGSCWGTLGLVRFVPPAIDAATAQHRAHELIREYGGKSEVDEANPDKPVVRVEIVYEVDDVELSKLAARLEAFPHLESLKLKSSRLTDTGVASLKSLRNLRALSLERAKLTDTGLSHLKDLPHLVSLNLKETKVTDAGAAEFRAARPNVEIER